jgi:uncharacterized repeat protein (TIGR01451 family)
MRELKRIRTGKIIGLLLMVGAVWGGVSASAQVQGISSATVTYRTYTNTNDNYMTTGGGSAGFPTGTVYNIRFNEGVSNQMFLGEVTVGGRTFDGIALAGQIHIARTTNATIKGEHHIVLYEQASYSGTNIFLKSKYAATMEESLRSPLINHGADNVFSDQGDGNGNNNNIQRIDYLFPDGLPVHSHIEQRGFLVMDRGGNDRFKIAAITALDGNGKPSAFGPPVSVLETQWGASGISLDTIVMRGYTEDGDSQHPSADVSPQPLSGVFLNWQTLGLQTNDLFYGYALAANDTTTNGAYWALVDNPTYFPTNTSPESTFGGLDLISGGLMFYDEALNVTLGDRAWDDWDLDGIQDAGEPGVTNVLVYVYDSLSNLAAVVRTDTNGVWKSPGHGPGTYFAKYFLPEGYEFTVRYAGTNTAIDSDADPITGLTAPFVMANAQTNLTLDAGLYRRATLGDFAWEDLDGDGQQDAGEPGLSNVAVRLYNATSNLLATTTSSVTGAYAFTNLLPGAYFVDFTAPEGYLFTASNAGADATDSDVLPGTNRTALVMLISGQAETTVDAGFYRPASFGDLTWVDSDGDGQQDGGEPALSNVVVRLYSATSNLLATTTSSMAGAYAFTNLAPGSYFASFTPPAGYLFTTSNVGADATDSDPLPGTNRTALVVLTSGQMETTVDAGFFQPAAIGDFTWLDTDSDGQQDAGEPGLSNVGVRLYNAATNLLATTTSSVAGAYAFTNLVPGMYFVGFTPPAGYVYTVANTGADATDSDALPGTGFTAPVVLTSGQTDATMDAGFVQPAAIGNFTWVDSDFDGQQDVGEPALANVVVRLYDAASNLLATTTSSVAGAYGFTNLSAGSYFVGFTPPTGYAPTTANTGADATDSDADPGTGLTAAIALTSGLTDHTVDAGFYDPSSVSLKLFKSSSLTGNWDYGLTNDYYITLQNTGTVAVAGVALSDVLPAGVSFVPDSAEVVELLAVTTNPFVETVSDGFGTVAYGNNDGSVNWLGNWTEVGDNVSAASGSVLVRVAGGTNALVFENTAADNDYVTRIHPVTAQAGRTYTNVSLSFAYRRQNWDSGDTFTFFVSTNGFAGQSNLVFSVPTTAGTDASYVQITTNLTGRMGAQMALRLRAGPNFALGDRVNIDFVTFTNSGYDVATNRVSTYGPGVQVNVVSNLAGAQPASLLANTTVPAGSSVTVRIRATLDVPLVSTQLVNTAVATNPATPPLTASVTNVSVANAVGDRVWFDTDGNGLQDGGEPGLAGVPVRLYSADSNLVAATTSGVAGAYGFSNLPSGAYFLEFEAPTNHVAAPQDQGVNDALDSDIGPATGRTAVFVLSGGTNDTSRDAGYDQPTATLGDFVWRDFDFDGLQDGGSETGMPGVVVRLYDAASNLVATTGTGASGAYQFTNVPTATYFLEFVPPAGFSFTLRDQGSDDAVDSDARRTTGRTAPFFVPAGTNDLRWDAGLVETVYGLQLVKTADAGACLAPGDTLTYTLMVANTGTAAQVGVAVEDVLPPGLTYVPGSAQVVVSNSESHTFRDEFSTVSYANQDGTGDWAVDWQENDPYGTAGPVGNYVGVADGRMTLTYLYVGDEAAWRWADLSAETNATLTFDWETVGLDANEFLDVQIGAGPAGPFTQLQAFGGTASGTASFDITGFISTGTTIRIEATPGTENWESGEYGYLDNIEIACLRANVTTNAAGTPPVLATNLTLGAGDTLTFTYQATVDAPALVTQLVNTASAQSVVQPVIYAATTNCVVYADVGVQKSVSDQMPDMLEAIQYTLVVSNNGPDVATGVVLTDVLPAQVQYNSHSNGAYEAGSGEWTLGTLAVGASTSITIHVTVRTNTAGLVITNTATVTGRDLFDPNPDNDTSQVVIVPEAGATLGNWAWLDLNRNGIQDASETNGLANLPVELLDIHQKVVATTVTSLDGFYQFEGIAPGTYVLRFDLSVIPADYATLSTPKAAGDDAVDSDVPWGGTAGLAWTEPIALSSGQTHLDVDLGVAPFNSTRVEMAEVWGEWTGGEGRVVWRTASEYGTAGFFAYRVDPESGAETRLSEILLPSAFLESGSLYGMVDPQAREGEAGVYRLEEMELSGEVRDLGRHEIRFDAPPPAAKAGRTVSKSVPEVQVLPKAEGPSSVLKVRVAQEGLVGVDLAALAAGMGLPLVEVQARAEAGSFQITGQGVSVPWTLDAARARLLFHAKPPVRNWYAHDSVYLISAGEGMALPRREPGATGGAAVFPVRLHFEEDRFLFAMTQMPDDFYFWAGVVSQTNDLLAPRFPLDLSGHAGGDVQLTVRLMGWSSTEAQPDHLAEFTFNGTVVGSIAFDGQETAEAELTVPGALVVDGENTLMVNGLLQPGRSHSFFVVDWIDATFDRMLEPRAEALHFRAGGAATVSAAAFADPLALALDEQGNATWIADENGHLPAKAWATARADERFEVVEAVAVPMVEPEPAVADAWFMAETNQIDYLVIASRALAPAAQELADYRSAQGLRSGVAVFEDICDLMAGGVRTPEAIPELLSYAVANWSRAPQMVVLAGNGHYDYLGANFSEANHLPPMLVQMPSGVCAADALMADSGGDALPDVALGRLPALTPAELTAMIAKIKAYENGFGLEWQNQLVLVADQSDSVGQFSAVNTRLASLVEGPYSVAERIDLDTLAIGPARKNLMDRFRSGVGFIHYTGHGGHNALSSQNLLSEADVATLSNPDRPPILMVLSCLVGRFEAPATSSLGEALMRRTKGGAVAVVGPSGLSRNGPAAELGEAFYRAILQDGAGRLGPAFLQARRSLSDEQLSAETYAVYNLLGDPALRIAGNEDPAEPQGVAQVLLHGLAQTYDGTPKSASATTEPAGLAVDFTYDGQPQPPTAAGSYAVVGRVVHPEYEGSAAGTLVIAQAQQTIDFPSIGARLATDSVKLMASASSGLPVVFEVRSGPAIWDGKTLRFTGPGWVQIVASQDGDGNWHAAPEASQSFEVRSPIPALEVSSTQVHVRESGEGRFYVRLTAAPAKTVVVGVSHHAGDTNLAVKTGAVRAFTPANWGTWQVVTLAAEPDANAVSETATFQLVAAGLETQLVAAATLDSDIGPNLALASGGAVITGTQANQLAQVIDGVHTSSANYGYTVWTNEPPGTMTLDLQVPATLSRVRVLGWDWNQRTHRYRIEASADGANWSVLADGSGEDRQGWDDWAAGAQEVRYLRYTGLTNSAGAIEALAEWEVYGQARTVPVASKAVVNVREGGEGRFFVRLAAAPTGTVVVGVSRSGGDTNLTVKSGSARVFTPTTWSTWQPVVLAAAEDGNTVDETASIRISMPGEADRFVTAVALDDDLGQNLALASGGATITGTQANQLGLLIDGVHTSSANYGYTVWTNEPPGTMTLDLQAPSTVSRVRLLNWDWSYRMHRYRIETSANGVNWTLQVDASQEDRQGWDDWAVNARSIRYLRFTGLTNSADRIEALVEWEVYGERPPLPQAEISKASVNVREGGEGRFFVRLASAPAGNIVVGAARSGGDTNVVVKSGATRTFTPANWRVWQAVTLSAGEDGNSTDETAEIRITSPGVADQVVTAVVLDDDIGQNLALASGGAKITGWKANQVGQLTDGVHTSSANYGYTVLTPGHQGTLTLDLQDLAMVSRVRLSNWDWTHRTHRYQIEFSADATNWTMLADASGDDRQGWDDWAVTNGAMRYLRFTGLASSSGPIAALVEWEVYGERTPPAARRSSAPRRLDPTPVESHPISVLTSDGPEVESGWAAVDGDGETAWEGQKTGGGYLVVEYSPPLRLRSLEVDMAAGSLTGIQYFSSLDGQDWQPLPDDMESRPVELIYLWLVFPDDGTEATPQVLEIRPFP